MSKGNTEVVGFGVPNKPATDVAEEASVGWRLSGLIQPLRQTFAEKRRKHALTLAHTILTIDPKQRLALMIQSSVRSELENDLQNAQQFVEHAILQPHNRALFERAETVLQAILRVDPENEDAKILLSEVIARQRDDQLLLPFPLLPDTTGKKRRVGAVLLIALFALGIIGGGLELMSERRPKRFVDGSPFGSSNVSASSETRKGVTVSKSVATDQRRDTTDFPTSAAVSRVKDSNPPLRMVKAAERPIPSGIGAGTPKPALLERSLATAISAQPAPVLPGILAVSAATRVDIYMGDKYLGATPVTLELSPGLQMIEYRNGNLRKTLSHLIHSNKTTTATVTFDVIVQINARPWAQVFLEGTQTLLGQTPMSDVRVPVGGVLVFRNPNFPEKKYRVSGDEKAIQMAFP